MRPSRILALVMGCLLVIPSIVLLLGGGALGLAYAFAVDDDGYFDATLERLESETVAVTADDITLAADPGSPDWVIDALDADVRIRATGADTRRDVFVGIGERADVADYLTGVAHDEVIDVDRDLEAEYRNRTGGDTVEPPAERDFWVASATGPGTQEVEWETAAGEWAVVVMNADATPGVAVDVNVGARAGFVLPLALIMLGVGAMLTALSVMLIVVGARGATRPVDGEQAAATGYADGTAAPVAAHPVSLTARLDPELSRWQWLVKWFLAIPHFIVLVFLWAAFVVLTLVAAVAIVFTGRYPRSLFEFNVGVLRWSWRVGYYATTGGIGTDRYPPFSLRPEPGEPAHLDVAYPERLSRGLVFVKWLLAIPHLIIVALLAGSSVRWLATDNDRISLDPTGGGGLLGILVLIAGVALLFTGRYPPSLFDLIVGFNRWIYRAIAYVALMTDTYPPFRLDQGGSEPTPTPDHPPSPPPPTSAATPFAAPPTADSAAGPTPDAKSGTTPGPPALAPPPREQVST